jgi:hypothetical protein
VVTHRNSNHFQFQGWRDDTLPALGSEHLLTKVHYKSIFSWRTQQDKTLYNRAYAAWVDANRRDVYVKHHSSYKVPDFVSRAAEVRDGATLPCWANWWSFMIASFLVCSWFVPPLLLCFCCQPFSSVRMIEEHANCYCSVRVTPAKK